VDCVSVDGVDLFLFEEVSMCFGFWVVDLG